jgi:hypothetical protein
MESAVSDVTRRVGDRNDVYNGRALMTKGGLKKEDLFEKNGRYVSKKMSENAKIRNNFVKKVPTEEKQKSVETLVDTFEKLITEIPATPSMPPPEPKKKKIRVKKAMV